MKNIRILIIAMAAIVAGALPASAQFRWGPRIGTEVNAMRFDKDMFNNENRAGFTGGITAEFTVPVIGIAMDASLMYVHRVSDSEAKINTGATSADNEVLDNSNFRKRDYFEIPINFKYKIGLPIVGKIVTPYVFTGPTFAFLASKRKVSNGYENRKFNSAWNIGAGVELISHLQVSASYGIGMNKVLDRIDGPDVAGSSMKAKNNYWTVTAAWLF